MCTLGAHARRAGLQRLGAADLAAILGDGGVVRHVLRLERARPGEPAIGEMRGIAPRRSSDLPTSEPVPIIMIARAGIYSGQLLLSAFMAFRRSTQALELPRMPPPASLRGEQRLDFRHLPVLQPVRFEFLEIVENRLFPKLAIILKGPALIPQV